MPQTPTIPGMHLNRMSRPRVFEYIDAVARMRSIRRAAEVLNVASSSVNRMIVDYERELGTPLFERHARGVLLTAAGEYMLAHIRGITRDFEAVRAQIDGLRNVKRGRVSIAAVEAAGGFLVDQLAAFHMEHRLVSYEVQMMGAANVAAAVEQSDAEIGLTLAPRGSSQITVVASTRYAFHAFVSDSHQLAKRSELRLSDCVGFPLALGDGTSGGRVAIERAFETLLLETRPFLTSNSFALMIETTRHTDAICFQLLPEASRVAGGRVVAIPLADGRLKPLEVGLIVNARRTLPTAAAILVDRLTRAMKSESTAAAPAGAALAGKGPKRERRSTPP